MPTNQGPEIGCIGGVVIDRKARLESRARPGTSNPVSVASCPGGAVGNIARNLARLGHRVSLFSIVGRDDAGHAVVREIEAAGIDVSGIGRSPRSPTANYTAVLEPGGELFIGLADMAIFEELDTSWADAIVPRIASIPVWILDANLPAATIERLLKTHKRDATVVFDPISVAKSVRVQRVFDAVDILFPNRKEAGVLSERKVDSREDVAAAAAEIRHRGVRTVIVTLGAEGVYIDDGHGGRFLPVIAVKRVVDVTGAGDAFVAGYVYGMLRGGKYDPALWGLAAASLTVETGETVAEHLNPAQLAERLESSLRRSTHESVS